MKQAINTRTQEEYDALMGYYESIGIEWGAFGQATNCPEFWEEYRELTCVTTEHREGIIEYAHTEFFVEEGYVVIPFTEFAKTIEPDYRALYLEGRELLQRVKDRYWRTPEMSGALGEQIETFLTKTNVTPNRDGE